MIRDIWQRTLDDLLEQWEIPYDFRTSPLPVYIHCTWVSHTTLLRSIKTANRIRGRTLALLVLTRQTSCVGRCSERVRKSWHVLRSGNVQFYAATTPEGFGWAYSSSSEEPVMTLH